MYTENYEEEEQQTYENNKVNNKSGLSLFKILAIIILIVIILGLLYFVFMKKSNGKTANYTLDVSPESVVVAVGKTQSIAYDVRNNGEIVLNAAVRLTVLDENIASINNTIVTGENYGKTSIIATYVSDTGETLQKTIEVTVADGNPDIPIDQVYFPEGDLQMPYNGSYDLNIEIDPRNGYVENKVITSSNSNVVMVDNNGKVTAVREGEATISIDINNGEFTRDIKVYVTRDSSISRMVISPTMISITKLDGAMLEGDSAVLKYTVTPANATVDDITWDSSNKNVVDVDYHGKITAVKEGTAMITVKTFNNISDTITVEVKKKEVSVERIDLSMDTLYLEVGQNQTISPLIIPDNATDKTLSYTIDNPVIAAVSPTIDTLSATIASISAGTATITIKSSNGVEKQLVIMVTDSSNNNSSNNSSSNSGSSSSCYCNSSNNCIWSSAKKNDYTNKQSRIPNSTACAIYSNNHGQACFKDSSGKYNWGSYGNTSGYTYVAGISSLSACTNGSTTTESLTCPSVYKGETGTCNLTSSVNSTIKKASSSDENIVKVTKQDGYKVYFECVNNNPNSQSSATITATTSTGKNIKTSVVCKSKTSISLVCSPMSVEKGKSITCTVSGISSGSQLKSCSSNKGTVSKSDKSCIVTYDQAGTVKVTAETTLGTYASREVTFTQTNKVLTISCPSSANIGDTVACTVASNGATGIKCSVSAANATASYSGGKCNVKYTGSSAAQIVVTFTSPDTPTYTRTISYVKSTPNVKTVTVSCVGRSATAFTCNVSNPNNVSLGYTIVSKNKGASATGSGGTWTITYTGGQANYAATFKVCSKDGTLITADSNGNGSTCISKSVTFNPKS